MEMESHDVVAIAIAIVVVEVLVAVGHEAVTVFVLIASLALIEGTMDLVMGVPGVETPPLVLGCMGLMDVSILESSNAVCALIMVSSNPNEASKASS